MKLTDRDRKSVWHPYTQVKDAQTPIVITSGEGVYLVDENERKYIDAVSSWWVNLHGHSHPYIAQKVFAQLQKLEHVIFAGFTHEPAIELAERLLDILPLNQSKIFYSDNGSTSVEVALKMALQFWVNKGENRKRIIAFEHSYHGDTFGAMSVSARSAFTSAFDSLLFEVIHIPVPLSGKEDHSIETLKTILNDNHSSVAAFIFEPLVLGAGGMLMYEAAALDKLIAICKDNGVLVIADEVMTGFGRTGILFASDYLTHSPDIICLSKGITGGTMALGVTSCCTEIFDAFVSDDRSKTLFHGHSYTANPVACAAALASMDLLLEETCRMSIERISIKHVDFVSRLKTAFHVKSARSCGTILALEFDAGQNSYFHSIRDELYNYFLDHGLIMRPLGNTIYLMPPYCITDEQLDIAYGAIVSRIECDQGVKA